MATFDKEHEEKVAVELLTHAMYEAQMTPEFLQNEGESFSSERAAFLLQVLSKVTARGLAVVEGIAKADLADDFLSMFCKQLDATRKELGVMVEEYENKQ